MEIKYTKHFLNKLEDLFSETDYVLRYEKGNFKSGYCLLKDTKIAMINKYYSQEGKINCLVEILRELETDTSRMSEKNRQLYMEINQTKLEL
jgi:predicted nuclease with TOPRIM domain